MRLDAKNIKRINDHNTTPCYNNNNKDIYKTGKAYKNDNQQTNVNFDDLRRYAKQ